MRNILVIDGHPDPAPEHLNHALAERYVEAAREAGADVRRITVARLDFPVLRNMAEFQSSPPAAIEAAIQDVRWAEHFVFFHPLWHGDMPAKLKAFIEQTFRPGVALDYNGRLGLPKKLMKGRTARLVVTMGMPAFFYRGYMGAHSVKALERMLNLAGVGNIEDTLFGGAGAQCESKTRAWFATVKRAARHDANPKPSPASRGAALLAKLLAIAVAAYAAYAVREWARYGAVDRSENQDPPLDRMMPDFEVQVRHRATVDAPAEAAFDAIAELDFTHLPAFVNGLFRAREILLRSKHDGPAMPRGLLNQLKGLGWTVLPEEGSKEVVLVTVTRPWEPNPVFRALPADEFAHFIEPGYAKIAMSLRADPIDDRTCTIATETRVRTTDPDSRALFRRYWAFLSPGIAMIRIALLQQVKREAESRSERGEIESDGCKQTRTGGVS